MGGNGSCQSWFFLRQEKKGVALLMLPKQEVLKGRAGSSPLFKGENTEGQTAGAGSNETLWMSENTASWFWLGQHVLPKGTVGWGPRIYVSLILHCPSSPSQANLEKTSASPSIFLRFRILVRS